MNTKCKRNSIDCKDLIIKAISSIRIIWKTENFCTKDLLSSSCMPFRWQLTCLVGLEQLQQFAKMFLLFERDSITIQINLS